MFIPPRCPNSACPRHTRPGTEQFFHRHGFYKPKCRAVPVPRFICLTCGRGFSRQTFRADYCDHKPHANAQAFTLLNCGLGLRQSARVLKMSRRGFEQKFRKIARHLGHLNHNLRGSIEGVATLQFDELETYEGRRNTRPLTLPILIDRESRFHVAAVCAPIRRGAR